MEEISYVRKMGLGCPSFSVGLSSRRPWRRYMVTAAPGPATIAEGPQVGSSRNQNEETNAPLAPMVEEEAVGLQALRFFRKLPNLLRNSQNLSFLFSSLAPRYKSNTIYISVGRENVFFSLF